MVKDSLKHVETMIGEDVVIEGNIILEGGAIISGKIFGNIRTNGPLRATQTAYIKGDITASDAYIGGVVEGNLIASGKVILKSQSVVKGDIVYRQLVIEEGAQFKGRCDIAHALGETATPETVDIDLDEILRSKF